MTIRFIFDYASPTTIGTSTIVSSTGFLREVLVVVKNATDETAITVLTEKPITEIRKSITGLFDAGLSKVSYIRRVNADLPAGLPIKNNFFTIILDGFSVAELGASNLGEFEGDTWFEVDNINTGVENRTVKMYNSTLDGYNVGYTNGLFLAQTQWSNLQYTPTSKNLNVVENLGTANTLFNNRLSFWGKDDIVGTRLLALFSSNHGATKNYLEKQISIELQANNLQLLSNGLKNTIVDAKIIENKNKSYIKQFYVDTGLVDNFTYSVKLSNNAFYFDAELDLSIPLPIWKVSTLIKNFEG